MVWYWFGICFLAISGWLTIIWRKAYWNTHQLKVERVSVSQRADGGNNSLKIQDEPLHILQISDMHMENLSITPYQIVEAIEGCTLDFIVLTGDFLDRRRSMAKLETYLRVFRSVPVRYGMYAVLGNHDYLLRAPDLRALQSLLAAYDVQLLRNEHVSLDIDGRRLNLIGIDDFSTGRSDLERSFHAVAPGCNIVITHDPNVVLEMADKPFDYLMAGHFHGGQIHWPKPYHLWKMGKLARQRRVRGLHYEHGRAFYISEGLGQTGVNIRLGSQPEMTIHSVKISGF